MQNIIRVFPKLCKVGNKGLHGENKWIQPKQIASSEDRTQGLWIVALIPW